MPFDDEVKGTEQLLRQRHREREGWQREVRLARRRVTDRARRLYTVDKYTFYN